jgi:hypothetical protein
MKKFALSLICISYVMTGWAQCAEQDIIYHFVYDDKSYMVVQELKSWSDAASCSKELGGYLVEINSKAEQTVVFSGILDSAGVANNYVQINNGGGIAYVWIGATDQNEEGQWIWDGDNDNEGELFWSGQGGNGSNDGSIENGAFVYWGGGTVSSYMEPDDYGELGQDHAAIGLTGWPQGSTALGSPGEWNDIIGSSSIYFVVEFDTIVDTGNPTGRIEPIGIAEVNIYPNPVSDYLFVDSEDLLNVEIFNLTGKLLDQYKQSPIQVDHLTPGIYLVKVTTYSEVVLRKVIIE